MDRLPYHWHARCSMLDVRGSEPFAHVVNEGISIIRKLDYLEIRNISTLVPYFLLVIYLFLICTTLFIC